MRPTSAFGIRGSVFGLKTYCRSGWMLSQDVIGARYVSSSVVSTRVGEVASVVGGRHAESDLVLLAAWDCTCQADASARVEAKAIHARITKADLAEYPQLAPDIVLVHSRVTDHVRSCAPVVGHRRSISARPAEVLEARRVVPHA